MKTASLSFFAAMVLIGALVLGLHIGEARAKAEAEKPVYLTRACPKPEISPTRWQCDAVELREYRNVCLKRAKRAEVK